MGFIKCILNVVTLGGHGRVKNAQDEYKAAYDAYNQIHSEAADLKSSIDHSVKRLGIDTKKAFAKLEKAHRVLAKTEVLHCDVRTCNITPYVHSTQRSEQLLSNYTTALSVGGGATLGSAAAIGSWSLVTLLGTASTGTHIATLSGVAATNASLAWFGGGALASGGAGMAGGGLVLGGIVVAPLIVFASWSAHKKANKLYEEIKTVEKEKEKCEALTRELRDLKSTLASQCQLIISIHSRLNEALVAVSQQLFPLGIFSRLRRIVRKIFRGDYYLESERQSLLQLDQAVEEFTSHFNV